jgi:hypothetical protein
VNDPAMMSLAFSGRLTVLVVAIRQRSNARSFIKPNLAHDITFSVVTPNDVAYTQSAARRGSFTDSALQPTAWSPIQVQ